MTIGRKKMESCFIVVFQHKGTGEILAHTAKNEEEVCAAESGMELAGHSVLYALSIFDDEVARYY